MRTVKPCFTIRGNNMDVFQIVAMFDTEQAADRILSKTDWTQIPNNGLTDACVTAFNEYRVAIRTIRRTNPDNPTWPDAPTEEWA